jgi:hypothetical protein
MALAENNRDSQFYYQELVQGDYRTASRIGSEAGQSGCSLSSTASLFLKRYGVF